MKNSLDLNLGVVPENDSPGFLYSSLVSMLINLLCDQVGRTEEQCGMRNRKDNGELCRRLMQLCKYMQMIEQSIDSPEDIGLSVFYSVPVTVLLNKLTRRSVSVQELG